MWSKSLFAFLVCLYVPHGCSPALGVSRLMDLLADSREIIRNDVSSIWGGGAHMMLTFSLCEWNLFFKLRKVSLGKVGWWSIVETF